MAGDAPLQQDYDLIILGAGCAGLACAIEAADLGGRVVVLEKMARPSGNILFAGGVVAAAGTRIQQAQGIREDTDSFYRDLLRASLRQGDPELTRVYARNSAEAIHWLSDAVGVAWSPLAWRLPPARWRVHEITGPLRPGGMQLSRDLLAAAKKRKIPIFYKVTPLELAGDPQNGVSGVRAETGSGILDFRAGGGVVLATGGFHANREMVREHIGGWAANMPCRGSNVNTGENIALCRPLGAQFVHMDQFHGGPVHGPTKANPSSAVNFGICVTRDGKRYVDEGWSYLRVGRETARICAENQAFIILDQEAGKSPLVADRIERYRKAGAPVYRDDTIEGLARRAGIGIQGLVGTVNGYNDAVRTGGTAGLLPPNTLDAPRPILCPGFYAIPFRGGITATFGGPLINGRAQVIGTGQRAIPGLYAAGNAAGGLFYGDYIVGSQLGAAIVFGRIAAADGCARARNRGR